MDIKNSKYTITDLVKDFTLAKSFDGGYALVFRLTPSHYHRYHYAATGTIRYERIIQGILHCVRPIALRNSPVFIENSRSYQVLDTPLFGPIVQMEVGALFVGKIYNHPLSGHVSRSQEKGYFEFGGSTIILLLQKEHITLSELLLHQQRNGEELSIHLGDVLGVSK